MAPSKQLPYEVLLDGRPFVVTKTGLIGIAAAGERAPEREARRSALGVFDPRRRMIYRGVAIPIPPNQKQGDET